MTAQTRAFMLSSFFFLKLRKPQTSIVQLLLQIIPIGIVGYAVFVVFSRADSSSCSTPEKHLSFVEVVTDLSYFTVGFWISDFNATQLI